MDANQTPIERDLQTIMMRLEHPHITRLDVFSLVIFHALITKENPENIKDHLGSGFKAVGAVSAAKQLMEAIQNEKNREKLEKIEKQKKDREGNK